MLEARELTPTSTSAEGTEPSKPFDIGIIDIENINENSIEMSEICDQADKLRKIYQEEITALEKKLREERANLDGAKLTLSTEEQELQERILDSKENQLRHLAHRRKNQWEQALESAKKEFSQRFRVVVEQVAKKRRLEVVLLKSAVPYHTERCDITRDVLESLNATAQPVVLTPAEGAAKSVTTVERPK
jgi:Skp family chaperone for outer membrane proteins